MSARRAFAFALALWLLPVGTRAADPQPASSLPPFEDPGPGLVDRYDPWESMNRAIYRFNANFDQVVFQPALRGYRFVFPSPLRRGFSNFFANVGEVTVFANSVFQLSPKKSAGTLARFVVNSTLGIGGFLDPAARIGLYGYDEDFGQTLGHYGMGPGPYLVLPILGPSSLRDATGLAVDKAAMATLYRFTVGDFFSNHPYLYSIYVIQALQLRADTPFHYGELGPFEYDLVRLFYLEHRQILIAQ